MSERQAAIDPAVPRVTQLIEVQLARSEQGLPQLPVNAVAIDIGIGVSIRAQRLALAEGVVKSAPVPEAYVFEQGAIRVTEDFELDIFTRMSGKSLDDFRPRLRYLETSGVRIPYLSPEDLIFLKEGSWRDKDKLDVQAMREIIAREGRQA